MRMCGINGSTTTVVRRVAVSETLRLSASGGSIQGPPEIPRTIRGTFVLRGSYLIEVPIEGIPETTRTIKALYRIEGFMGNDIYDRGLRY